MTKKSILAVALLMAATAPAAWAQSKTGTTIGAFLGIEPSARIAAMGNAGVSLDGGLDGAYYNPAAIARLERNAVVFSHSAWIADITFDHVGAAVPMGRWGNAYASVTALGSGEIDVRTVSRPLGTGERYTVSDVAIGVGYGKEITDRFSVGLQATYVQETIWNSTMATGTLSIGTLYRTSERGLHLGASLTNFGTAGGFSGTDLRITYDADPDRNGDNATLPGEVFTEDYSVPVLFRAGIGLPVRVGNAQWLHLALDARHPNDNTESVSAGAEYSFRDLLALRLGWQDAFEEDAETGLTAGGGLGGKLDVYAYRLDYAWADHGRLGSTHRFSVALQF